MDVSSGLLVAMMYVMILSLGIVGLLSSVAGSAVKGKLSAGSRLRTSWVWLLLLELLSMFWSTLTLLEVSNWTFLSFLFILVGPILLFFASSVLIATDSDDSNTEKSAGTDFSYRFFYMLAGVEAWIVVLDLTLGSGFAVATLGNILVGLLVLFMALKPTPRVWATGTGIAWLLVIANFVVEGMQLLA
jgi:hypothetical protein